MSGTAGGRAPLVTVVVATHNRAGLLPWMLGGLAGQGAEVVVVDDASTDATPRVLAQAGVTTVRLPYNAGPGAARNAGWRRATTDVVAFLDDDCRPEPGWVDALASAVAGADVVQGRTIPDPDASGRRGPWSHTMEIPRLTGSFETCNIAYRRELLERLDGFDESYRTGEDVDLGCRAVDAGARVVFAADAVVRHDVSRSEWTGHVRRLRHRDGAVRAIAAHPRMRRNLFHGLLFSEAHPPAVVAAAGIVVALAPHPTRARMGVAAALVAPYLAYRTFLGQVPHARKWTWPWVLPMAWAADLAEVAILVRASWRHRTLVL